MNELEAIAKEVRGCTRCPLAKGRKNAVPGEGGRGGLMLVGEAPGRSEDEQGRPFVGPAGKKLDEALRKAGVERREVFITSVVKCRPPGNREPKPEEVAACRGYLERQVEAVGPKAIVLLGRVAYSAFTGKKGRMKRGLIGELGGAKLYATYHPAVALHGRPSWLKVIVEDIKVAAKS